MAVGVFDSGLGGLTVVKEIKKKFPQEQIIYLGDTARVPYGTRSPETIVKFSMDCMKFLEQQGVNKIIIACNTASAYAYEEVKKEFSGPVFEMISWGAKGAVDIGAKNIGVIATRATVKSGMYEKKIRELKSDVKVRSVATPLLVPLVEEGEVQGEIIEAAIRKSLTDLYDVESLVLGCTHYPVVAEEVQKILPRVRLVNPGVELAKAWEAENDGGEDVFCFTDMTERYKDVAEMFLGGEISGKLVQVKW